jgi:Nucleotide-diphospho-sugar transferase
MADTGDIVGDVRAENWIVCGYFTPDYRHWAERLAASLGEISAPFHLFAQEKVTGGWEANTRQKPAAVRKATLAYPERTLIFIDVDAVMHRTPHELIDLSGDIGLRFRYRPQRRHRGELIPMAGTLVIKPTSRAKRFVDEWVSAASAGTGADNDQDALRIALVKSPFVAVASLPQEFSATGPVASPCISQSRASRDHKKISRLFRRLGLNSIWKSAARA